MLTQRFDNPGDALAHHGVKGMKWGRRKSKDPKEVIEGFGPKTLTSKTKNGDEFTLVRDPESKIAQALARRFPKHRNLVESSSMMTIKDKSGARIGTLQLFKESKDSMNITWIDIEDSARGHGYAQAVMKSAEGIARKQGLKQLTLEVPGISPDARHIYEKQGFTVTKNPKNTKDVWGGLTHMVKDIS